MQARYFIFVMVFGWSACQPGEKKAESEIEEKQITHPVGKWIDLTYPYDENTIYWPTSEPFQLDTVFEGTTDGGYYYSAFKFCSAEHGGTHLDAPIHFSEGKRAVDELTLDQLSGPAIVIDVSEGALENRDYLISVDDIQKWEESHGKIDEGVIVLIRTGYGRFWPDRIKYMGTDLLGEEGVANLHFPGLHPEAAQWLVDNRNIGAIGLDTPSIDFGQSSQYESHQILFEKNIPAIENVANLAQLPVTGSWVMALPMKIKGGSGGPVRVVALIPN
ncbi:cyclase family protein [Fulvivirgaceae bacterium BMA10]|uniref:Cyclase family protein n=1 Tax=Splendidivirga corallicola TaxID=3051826 RepID=A0ABT8KUA1_9BACT|nr:cyclase family protein [Fulvivirgaceae bacterium BMA10]